MLMTVPVRGQVDAQNRLVAADPPLAALQRQAGGAPGEALAIPPLASLVRLVRRLGIDVARPMTVADGASDLELFVRASPADGQVSLAIAGWLPIPARQPAPAAHVVRGRDMARAAADWTWETDASLNLVALSPQVKWGLGRSADAVVGRPLTEFIRLIEDASGSLPLLSALADHGRAEGQLAELIARPGSYYRLSAQPLIDGDGHFGGFRGTATRAADPLLGEPPLIPADSTIGADRLAEDLRHPLGRIVAQAETIAAQEAGPIRHDYADYATDIAAAARHLLALVDDLVDLDAVERSDFRPQIEMIDLADVARRAAGLLGVRAAGKDLLIEPPAADFIVPALGEYRRVLQIAVNLLGNAVRHAPHGSRIVLAVTRSTDGACLSVTDQGPGIRPEDQERAFAKFVRLRPSEGEGSGLGLYISRRLARAMGGDLLLDSKAGEGSRFTLVLPLADR